MNKTITTGAIAAVGTDIITDPDWKKLGAAVLSAVLVAAFNAIWSYFTSGKPQQDNTNGG